MERRFGASSRYAASAFLESLVDDSTSILPFRAWADQAVEAHEIDRNFNYDGSTSPSLLVPTSTTNNRDQTATGNSSERTGLGPPTFQLHPHTESELYASRVYMRTKHGHSMSSLSSRHDSAAGLSFLSKISLTQISSISVISLPIYYNELWNLQQYRDLKQSSIEVTVTVEQSSSAMSPTSDSQIVKRQEGVPDAVVGHKEERSLRATLKLSLKRRLTAEKLRSTKTDRVLAEEARQHQTKVLLLGNFTLAPPALFHAPLITVVSVLTLLE